VWAISWPCDNPLTSAFTIEELAAALEADPRSARLFEAVGGHKRGATDRARCRIAESKTFSSKSKR